MKTDLLSVFLGVGVFVLPCCVQAKMKVAEYSLTNECHVSVQVEVLNLDGKLRSKEEIKPGKSLEIGSAERIIIHCEDAVREYSLPSKLHLHVATQGGTNSEYTSMLGGKWRLSVTNSELLSISCMEGGEVGAIPDLTKPPVGFPLRPRRTDETFEEYSASLIKQNQATLKREIDH